MSKYAAVNVKFGADISQFSTAMQNAARQMKKAGDQLQNVGRSMTMNLTAPIVALGAAALYSFGQIDSLKRGLISFTGSAQLAEEEFNKLREVAKLPGIGLEEAVRGSINLQAIGMNADKAREAMSAFGNAIATVGGGKENFDLAIRGFGQLTNASKPLQQDLYQIANQLPQVNKLMIEAFGTNRAEDLAAMGMSGKQLAEFLVTELGKLPKVSGGIKNSFENMSDSVKVSLASFGEAIEKNFNISGKIDALSKALSNMVEWFKQLNPAFQKFILAAAGVTAILGPLMFAFGGLVKIFPLITAGFAAMSAIFLPEIIAMVAAGIYLYSNWDAISDRIVNVFVTISQAVINSVKSMVGALDWFFSKFNVFTFSSAGVILETIADKLPKKQDAAEFLSFGESVKKVYKDIFSVKDYASGGGGIGAGDPFKDQSVKGAKGSKSSNGSVKEEIINTAKEMEVGFEYMDTTTQAALDNLDHTFAEASVTLPDRFKAMREKTSAQLTKMSEEMKATIENMAMILQNGVQDMVVGLATAFGENLVDKDPFNDLGLVLLGSLGKLMVALGTAMITFSSIFVAFKKAIQTMQPEIAIPLGIAMVAAGAAISKIAANGMSSSSAGAASYGSSGGTSSGGNIVLTTRLDGRDLVMSGTETSRVRRR